MIRNPSSPVKPEALAAEAPGWKRRQNKPLGGIPRGVPRGAPRWNAAPGLKGSYPVSLDSSIQYLKGVGPRRFAYFKRLGLATLRDLLYHLPRRHEDRRAFRTMAQLVPGEKATVCGRVTGTSIFRAKTGTVILQVVVRDATGTLVALWFNQPYMRRWFPSGTELILYGMVERIGRRLQMSVPEFEVVPAAPPSPTAGRGKGEGFRSLHMGRIVPIYPATSGLHQRELRTAVARALKTILPTLPDPLPSEIRRCHGLPDLRTAMKQVHFPSDFKAVEAAQGRLSFDELLCFQLALGLRRRSLKEQAGIAHRVTNDLVSRWRQSLPFSLTAGQEKAIQEIAKDMAAPSPMHRLLQGEVGSGKTVVAAFCILVAVSNGFQAALLAPTEVLARQHALTLSQLFSSVDVPVALLTSSLEESERRSLAEGLREGSVPILVGTHALLEPWVVFPKLGLVVIDEQQKFGVEQRNALVAKGLTAACRPTGEGEPGLPAEQAGLPAEQAGLPAGQAGLPAGQPGLPAGEPGLPAGEPGLSAGEPGLSAGRQADRPGRQGGHPDVLILTATPIPRTLALTLYGELEISTISERPEGRASVKTIWMDSTRREEVYAFVKGELDKGRQAFVVCPRIGSEGVRSEGVRSKGIPAKGIQPEGIGSGGIRAEVPGPLWGRPRTGFSAKGLFQEYQRIFAGYRVGLLHGRMFTPEQKAVFNAFKTGEIQVLVATQIIEVGVDVPNATVMVIEGAERFGLAQLHQLRGRVGRGQHEATCILMADLKTPTGAERLQTIVQVEDAFKIAEEDLRLRGPGELLGKRQAGLPDLKCLQWATQGPWLEMTRRETELLLARDPNLSEPTLAGLKKEMHLRFPSLTAAAS